MNPDVVGLADGLKKRLARLGGNVREAAAVARVSELPTLTTEQYFAFWDALADRAPADIGLRLATETKIHEYDVSSLAALHSPDLRTALEKIARYKRLCGPKELAVDIRAAEATVSTSWFHARRAPPVRLIDASLASQLVLFRRASGRELVPKRVELMRVAASAEEPMLRRFFEAPIRFRAKRDALVFATETLAVPFITRNDDVLSALVPGLEAKLGRGRSAAGATTFIDEVRSAVARRMSGEKPSLAKTARELHLSVRTLQRRLGEHRVSYQAVLDDVRHQSARRLLRQKELDVNEIAFLLGFEELNSFSRAFRTWEGVTPHQYRDRVMSAAPTDAVA